MYRHRSFLIVYASKLGHARKIASWLAARFEQEGIETNVVEVGEATRENPRDYSLVIAVASIHFDRPSRPMLRWLSKHRGAFRTVPLELVSVSLTAAAKGEDARRTVDGYTRQLAAAAGAEPVLSEHAGGALQYSRYGRLTAALVRRAARDRGLPTDLGQDVELTDWARLEQFAARTVALADRLPTAAVIDA